MSYLLGFLRFWYDFVVGDSVVLALGGGLAIAASAALVEWSSAGAAELALPSILIIVLTASVVRR